MNIIRKVVLEHGGKKYKNGEWLPLKLISIAETTKDEKLATQILMYLGDHAYGKPAMANEDKDAMRDIMFEIVSFKK